MTPSPYNFAIVAYTGALKSAVYGLSEMLHLTNTICIERGEDWRFTVDILDVDDASEPLDNKKVYSAVLIPPTIRESASTPSNTTLLNWLYDQHAGGAKLCSACAGAYMIAATGLLDNKEATTHWAFGETFRQHYPNVLLNTDKIVINGGDIITAGGLMSWIDLGLELVTQFTNSSVMRQLGKMLVVDTGVREQRYYQSFSPKMDHGDHVIVKAQQILQSQYRKGLSITSLAKAVNLTERTFLRRFVKATHLKPNDYLQRLRTQKACELLEETKLTFESISREVGYGDISACRRVFVKLTGLFPSEFRRRFAPS